MLPLKLCIKGLYSYQEEQEINFEKLTQNGLFGIFGAVGSGKSSILEAIIFAIYDNTERLNAKERRSYNMMNLKSNEMNIDFECLAGHNASIRYRFVVNYKRDKKDREKISKGSRHIYKWIGEEWLPTAEEPKNIIGLNYDNFRRTIIIPQGQFSEFLHSGGAERMNALMEIFQLEKYDLAEKVSAMEQANKTELVQLDARMGPLKELTEENLVAEMADLALTEAEENYKSTDLAAKSVQESGLVIIKELYHKLEIQAKLISDLELKSEEFLDREGAVRRYREAITFKDILDNRQKQALVQTDLASGILQNETLLKQNEAEFELKERIFLTTKEKYENRETLKKQAETIGKLISLRSVEAALAALNKEATLQKANIEAGENKILALKSEIDSLQTKQQGISESMPDPVVLKEVNEWFTVYQNICNRLAELEIEKAGEELALQEILDKKDAYMAGLLILKAFKESGIAYNPADKDTAGILDKARGFYLEAIDLKEKEWQQQLLSAGLDSYRDALASGEPCPLCGSLDHPVLHDHTQIAEQKPDVLQSELNVLKKSLQTIEAANNEVQVLRAGYQAVNMQKRKIEETIAAKNTEAASQVDAWKWPQYDSSNPTALQAANKNYISLSKELKETEETLNKARKNHEAGVKNRDGLVQASNEMMTEVTKKETEAALLKAAVTDAEISFHEGKTDQSLQQEVNALLKTYETLEKDFKTLESEISVLSGAISDNRGRLKQMKEQFQLQAVLLEEQDNTINQRLKVSSFENIAEILILLNHPIDVDAEDKAINGYKTEKQIAYERFNEYNSQLAGKPYDEKMHEDLVNEIAALKSGIDGLKETIGRKKETIAQLEKQLEEKSRLETEFKYFEDRRQNINTLKSLFTAKGFVNYISSIYLHHLCEAANIRFGKLTRQSLKLELTPDNSFQVRDLLNGGLTRHIKTLSGGQTFQAALSLALSLADSTQKLAGNKQNFFFLDEGFGSLDKESLQTVLETLKALQKENRVVGVISHLEELQQEINVSLSVYNDENRGSVIRYSWEA